MIHAPNPDNPDIAVIKDFERHLNHRFLRKEGTVWYADFAANPFPEELPTVGDYIEGAKKTITVNAYERDPETRRSCIKHYRFECQCYGFDFETLCRDKFSHPQLFCSTFPPPFSVNRSLPSSRSFRGVGCCSLYHLKVGAKCHRLKLKKLT